MSIILKKHLDKYVIDLETCYEDLRKAMTGEPPIANTAHLHGFDDVDEFASLHREVNMHDLTIAIGRLKVEIAALKDIKGLIIKPTAAR